MKNLSELRDLLKHEVKDLHSAEEQIIDALPKMIEKTHNKELRKALQEHLEVTKAQKERLDEVVELLEGESPEGGGIMGLWGDEKCLAMKGLISEAEKLMRQDMSPGVSDAAIIAAAQKIEHYEISGYGTAKAYAQELNLEEVEEVLTQTLNEEYEADKLLTQLAEDTVNERATSEAGGSGSARHSGRGGARRAAQGSGQATEKASSKRTGSSSSRSRNGGGSPATRSGKGRSGRRRG